MKKSAPHAFFRALLGGFKPFSSEHKHVWFPHFLVTSLSKKRSTRNVVLAQILPCQSVKKTYHIFLHNGIFSCLVIEIPRQVRVHLYLNFYASVIIVLVCFKGTTISQGLISASHICKEEIQSKAKCENSSTQQEQLSQIALLQSTRNGTYYTRLLQYASTHLFQKNSRKKISHRLSKSFLFLFELSHQCHPVFFFVIFLH